MCAAVRPSARAARRADRGSTIALQMRDKTTERELISVDAEPAYHADSGAREHRPATLALASEGVGDVYFDERNGHPDQRIAEREAAVRIGARVHDGRGDPPLHAMDEIDEIALAVMLRELQVDAQLSPHVAKSFLDVSERCVAIQLGFARPEQVQVRSIEDSDDHRCLRPSSHCVNFSTSSFVSWPSTALRAPGIGCSAVARSEKN